jgi:hypothetical protein
MKARRGDKVKFTDTTVEMEGEENPGLMIATIKRLLGALGSKAETCRRDSPAPYRTTLNVDNIDAVWNTWLRAPGAYRKPCSKDL